MVRPARTPPRPRPAAPTARRTHRAGWLALAVLVVAVAAVVVVRSRPVPLPAVPAPATAGADPELVASVDAARAAVEAAPRTAAAWGKYGMVLQAHEFEPDAVICYRAAAALDPADGRWPHLLARLTTDVDPAGAIEWFDRALAGTLPADARANAEAGRAEALLAIGRGGELVLPDRPRTPRQQLLAARLAADRGDDARAAGLLPPLADHPAAARQSLVLLAQVLRRLDRPDDAELAGRRAATLPPDAPWPDPVVDTVFALNRTRVGRLEEARRLLRAGRPADAERVLRPLADAGDNKALFGLVDARADQNDRPGALQLLAELLRRDPTHTDARFQIGLYTFDDGERLWAANDRPAAGAKFRDAVAALDAVLAAHPGHPKATLLKAVALERFLGRPADGIRLLQDLVRARPELGEGHLRLGEALAAAGRPAEARDSLRRAAALAKPGDARAAVALAGLRGG